MQEIITRAAAAAEKCLGVPVAGPALAMGAWAQSLPLIKLALRDDGATTDELLKEAETFDINDKHYVLRARLQFERLARARRAGR